MTTPTVSVLVPTYNCADYLPTLCRSIQQQTFSGFEALLWDDGSTDNTAKVVAPFLHDERFRFVRAPNNQGLGKTWRELLVHGRGEFWCSPGADDFLLRDFLERRVAKLRAEPQAALVHGRPIHIDEKGNELSSISEPVQPASVQAGADALLALLEHNYINQPSVLARSEVTRSLLVGWRNDWKYAPDWHLWILHAATGRSFLYDDVPAHQYRRHPQSLSNTPQHEAVRRAEDRLVPLVACHAAAQISAVGADMWRQWRRPLHALWLRRAWMVRKDCCLDEMLMLGKNAFREQTNPKPPILVEELSRHALEILWFSVKESWARQNLSFQPVGLAQARHPWFERRCDRRPHSGQTAKAHC